MLSISFAASVSVDLDSHGMMRRESAKLHDFNATATNTTAADTESGDSADASGDSSSSTGGTVAASAAAPTSALHRADLSYNYVEEKVPGACDSHFEYQGLLSNDECAARCYATYGCTRFSAGGCDLGCRISNPHKNNPSGVAVPPDGQCPTSAAGTGAGCVVYQLTFFHAVDQPGSCNAHFELQSSAQNKAECAHACKNTPGCTKFTAEPNCMSGCRISKCNSNSGSTQCPTDSQCTITTESGCTMYQVFR